MARSFLLKTVFTNRDAADKVASRCSQDVRHFERATVEDGPERDGAATWRVRVWVRESARPEYVEGTQ